MSMKVGRLVAVIEHPLARASLAAIAAAIVLVPAASAHTHPCHSKHECPSDHASYKWRGMWCVSPAAEERTEKFKIRVRYGGRTYFCHRGKRP